MAMQFRTILSRGAAWPGKIQHQCGIEQITIQAAKIAQDRAPCWRQRSGQLLKRGRSTAAADPDN